MLMCFVKPHVVGSISQSYFIAKLSFHMTHMLHHMGQIDRNIEVGVGLPGGLIHSRGCIPIHAKGYGKVMANVRVTIPLLVRLRFNSALLIEFVITAMLVDSCGSDILKHNS